MVLVDTSVWIRSLANRAPYKAELDRLLALDEVSVHELVYGELLIGDMGGRKQFLSNYDRLSRTNMVPHEDVVAFVRHGALHGRGVGWIDIHLLAVAVVEGLQIWTADQSFADMAAELGVAYEVAGL